jgi:hypothetical protein
VPMSTSRLNVGQVARVVLTGCHSNSGSRAASSPRSTSAATQKWRNATYTITCDGVVPGGVRATLKNGAAQVPADVSQNPYYDYYDVQFEAAATGDVDGDGRPDTVVLLQCSPQPSNGIVEEAQVFSGGGRLDVLPSPGTLREARILAPVYDPGGLSVQHGDIVAALEAYGPKDSHASGPSQHVTVSLALGRPAGCPRPRGQNGSLASHSGGAR